jgi:cytochrome P450
LSTRGSSNYASPQTSSEAPPESLARSLFSPAVRADPYPTYRRLREEAAVTEAFDGVWTVASYDDCRAILRDTAWSSDPQSQRDDVDRLAARGRGTPIEPLVRQIMLFRDPPDHTRLRGLVQQAFSPRRIQGMRAHIETVVDDLLEPLARRGEMELVSDFAFHLPVIVIAELLGIPAEDRDRFRDWALELGHALEPRLDGRTVARAGRAAQEFWLYINRQIATRREQPEDDLLTALLEAEEEGDRLTRKELVANCAFLLIAGHETTTNLIGIALLALIHNPDQAARIRDDPDLAESAVEELLRYDGPVQLLHRSAARDTTLRGHTIAAGDVVLLLLGAANRDPARFEEPDVLDVSRPENRHLALGGGPHYCLGNALARMETAIALPALLQRLADIRISEPELRYRPTIALRGLESLRLEFRPLSAPLRSAVRVS